MADAKTHYEVAADIIIAMLQHSALSNRIGGDHKQLAQGVAEAYKTIYKAVTKPTE